VLNLDSFKRYFANTAWLMLERVVRVIATLFITIYLARYLGPEQFGIFNYAISFVGLFSILAIFVSDDIVIREIIKQSTHENYILGAAFFLRFIGSILVFILTISIHYYFFYNPYNNVMTLISILAIGQIFQSIYIIIPLFYAKIKAKFVVQAQIIQLVIGSLIKLYFIFIHAPLSWFAWAIFFDNFLLAIILYLFYRQQGGIISHWYSNFLFIKYLALESVPLVLSGVLTAIYMRIDQVMIGRLLNNTEVGYYAAAVRISEAWYFIPIIISTSLFPVILNMRKNNIERYYENLERLYKLLCGLSWVSALSILFLSDYLIYFIYGVNYASSSDVLVIHIWTGFFVSLGIASGKALIAENLLSLVFFRTVIGAILNILLNSIFIPLYGILGAAWATLISQIIVSFLYDAYDSRTHRMFKMKLHALIWPFPRI